MNLETIKAEFELNGNSSFELKKELMQKMALIHPDKNKGEFVNDTDKELFYKINTAVEYIEKLKTPETSIITITDAKDLIGHFAKQVSLATQASKTATDLSHSADRSLNTIKKRNRLPRITSAAATVTISALWLFPNQVKEHPTLGKLFNAESAVFIVLWFTSLLLTILIWIRSHMKEQSQESFLKRIKSTTFQNRMFSRFVKEQSDNGKTVTFSKNEFIDELLYKFTHDSFSHRDSISQFIKMRLLYPTPEFDINMAEEIADSVFSRAEDKGLIQKIKSSSLEDQYTLKTNDQN